MDPEFMQKMLSGGQGQQSEPQEPESFQGQGGQDGHPVEQDKFSDKFAALTKKERELLAMQEELKKWRSEKEEHEKKYSELSKWKQEQEEIEKIKEIDPLEYLGKKGLDYEKLTEHVVNRDDYAKDAEFRSLKKEMVGMKEYIEDLKKEIKGFQESYTQEKELSKKAQEEQATNQYLDSIKEFIDEKAEEFELVKTYGDPKDILDMQVKYYEHHNKPASLDELLGHYEKYLEEKMEEQYNKMKGLKKYSSKFQKSLLDEEDQGSSNVQQLKYGHSSFYGSLNDLNSLKPPRDSGKVLNRDESLAEAAKMLRFIKN